VNIYKNKEISNNIFSKLKSVVTPSSQKQENIQSKLDAESITIIKSIILEIKTEITLEMKSQIDLLNEKLDKLFIGLQACGSACGLPSIIKIE
jgi:hypothetical protein